MPQNTDQATFRGRLAKLQDAMKEFGIQAVILEPGAAMMYLTGVRCGRSERTFAVVLPARGEPAFILPGFEEMRARELTPPGADIRIWQEDESPYRQIVQVLRDRDIVSGRVAIDDSARFFVFDGIRKLAPKFEYVSAVSVLKSANVDTTAPQSRRQ